MRKILFFTIPAVLIIIIILGAIHYFSRSQSPMQIISSGHIAEGGGEAYAVLKFEKLYSDNLKKFNESYNLCQSLNNHYENNIQQMNCDAISIAKTDCVNLQRCPKSYSKK